MESKMKMENCFCVLILIYGMCHRVSSQVPGNNDTIDCVETNTKRTCYFAYKEPYNWNDAWLYCQGANGQLAHLNTAEVDNKVGAYINRITADLDEDYSVWIGGREVNNPYWKWLDEEQFTSGNTSNTMIYFSLQGNRYETCAVVGSNGTSGLYYQSAQCRNARNHFICYNNLTSDYTNSTSKVCSIGSNAGVTHDDRCYATISASTPLTWFQARYECNKMNSSDLAIFNDSRDHDLIISLLPAGLNQTFWIGLRKYEWVWPNAYDAVNVAILQRSEISYSGWFSGNPVSRGKSCMAVLSQAGTQGWVNGNCSEKHPFICEQTTIFTTTAPTTTPPITTLPTTTPGPTIIYEYIDENVTIIIDGRGADDGGAVCGGDDYSRCVASIVVPVVIVAVVLIFIGFTLYCYFSKRREGYVQH